ncbi:MAG: RNA polymerase sigma factor [Myxococcota bacterium]
MDLDEHLFRRESGRLIAALTRIFGVHNLTLAEDVVQDAFCRALEVWKTRGVPEDPSAWLMTTAKNRALDLVRRQKTARRFAPELGRMLDSEWTLSATIDEAFSAQVVRDEQLRMMFSCCQPRLAEPVQIALILNLLCGFGAHEIAEAFLTGRAAIEKRITRGKQALASSTRLFVLDDAEFVSRLGVVQRTLYLLFNEGYHGASREGAVRAELCHEALRLVSLLREHPPARTPETDALAALMCLQAGRLPARLDATGELSSLLQQDRSRWDASLIHRGLELFEASARGAALGVYHLEAAIAATHVSATSPEQIDWNTIVSLYDRLLELESSPVVALNRAIAVGERDGPQSGLRELQSVPGLDRLANYPFYPAALAEFELRCGNRDAARRYFERAGALARNDAERRFLKRRQADCA